MLEKTKTIVKTMKKPNTRTAMQSLLDEITASMPLASNQAQFCEGSCIGCPKKLAEFMAGEVEYWQCALDSGAEPHFGDLESLVKTAKKVHKALWKNEKLRPYLKPYGY